MVSWCAHLYKGVCALGQRLSLLSRSRARESAPVPEKTASHCPRFLLQRSTDCERCIDHLILRSTMILYGVCWSLDSTAAWTP